MDHALLEGCILKALPNLPDAQVHSILSVLDELGVETEEELQFVVPADLDNIPAIKARKLLKFWRSKGEKIKCNFTWGLSNFCYILNV